MARKNMAMVNLHKSINVSFPLQKRCADLLHGEWNRSISDTLVLVEAVQPPLLIDTTKDPAILGEVRNQPPSGNRAHKGGEPFNDKTIKKK
jgi:hypothetical protein